MAIVVNSTNALIKGWTFNHVRVDILPHSESSEIPDETAKRIVHPLYGYSFLTIKDEGFKAPLKKDRSNEITKEFDGLSDVYGIGKTTVLKLHTAQITSKKLFLEQLVADPIFIKNIVGAVVWKKLVDSGVAKEPVVTQKDEA